MTTEVHKTSSLVTMPAHRPRPVVSRFAIATLALSPLAFAPQNAVSAPSGNAPAPTTSTQTAPKTASSETAKPAAKTRTRKTTTAAKSTTPRAKGTAYLRVLHALSGAPSADVFVGSNKLFSATQFKRLSDYLPVSSGRHQLRFKNSETSAAILEAPRTFSRDKYYTAVISGSVAKPSVFVLNDSSGKAVAGKAKVRVIHLAPDLPALNLTMPSTRAKNGFTTWRSNLTFGKSALLTRAPGTFTLQLRTTDDKMLREVPNVVIEADKRYSVFAIGQPIVGGVQALDVIVASGAPNVVTAPAAPTASAASVAPASATTTSTSVTTSTSTTTSQP
jgi:hypothetical protein